MSFKNDENDKYDSIADTKWSPGNCTSEKGGNFNLLLIFDTRESYNEQDISDVNPQTMQVMEWENTETDNNKRRSNQFNGNWVH